MSVNHPAVSPVATAPLVLREVLERLLQVFRGEDQGAHRHALLLGAALVLEVTAQSATPRDALAMAAAAIDSGAALRMAEALRAFGASASATA